MSDLVGNPEDRFSRVEAQILVWLQLNIQVKIVSVILGHCHQVLGVYQYYGETCRDFFYCLRGRNKAPFPMQIR